MHVFALVQFQSKIEKIFQTVKKNLACKIAPLRDAMKAYPFKVI